MDFYPHDKKNNQVKGPSQIGDNVSDRTDIEMNSKGLNANSDEFHRNDEDLINDMESGEYDPEEDYC